MSFSSDVRDEIKKENILARHCMIAEFLAYFMIFARVIEIGGHKKYIIIKTENLTVAKKSYILLNRLFKIKPDVSVQKHSSLNSRCEYMLLVKNAAAAKVLKSLKYDNYDVSEYESARTNISESSVKQLITASCCKKSYLKGTFLSVGSVTDPKKAYHLEMVARDEIHENLIKYALESFGIQAKQIMRKGDRVLYIKEAETISDFLGILGAGKAMMELENVRILKEVRNNVNRQVNCETANITKTVNAAQRQIEDIKTLEARYGFDNLPKGLKEVCILRLENPDASLNELSALSGNTLSKSCINHRLRKISEMAVK